jgi:synaptotagmin-14/16
MATVRVAAEADSWSLSRGLRDYLACCFTATSSSTAANSKQGAAAGGDTSSTSGAKKELCLTPSPRTTQRVRCTHKSFSEDDDDDDTDLLMAGGQGRRPEADGASVHSAGAGSAGGRPNAGASELAIRQGLDSMLTEAAAASGRDSTASGRRSGETGDGSISGRRVEADASGSGNGMLHGDRVDGMHSALQGSRQDVNGSRHGSRNDVERNGSDVDASSIRSTHGAVSVTSSQLGHHHGPVHDDDVLVTADSSDVALLLPAATASTSQSVLGGGSPAGGSHAGDFQEDDDDEHGGLGQHTGTAAGPQSLSAESERVNVETIGENTSRHSPMDDQQSCRTPPNVHFADSDDQPGHDVRPAGVLTSCGSIRIVCRYDADRRRLTVTLHDAVDLPAGEDRGGASHSQVHVVLLPAKKLRHKTHAKPGASPTFNESFDFKVAPDELNSMGLRLRLYGCERLRRERLIGEAIVSFLSLGLQSTTGMATAVNVQPVERWIKLEPRSNISHADSLGDLTGKSGSASSLSAGSDSGSPNLSMQHGGLPELMLGLAYNETTGRLSVEVIKGSNFKNMAVSRPPDTSVKLALMSPNGQEISHSKTSVRRGQPNPLYKEMFMFQVPQSQLPDVSLLVSVFATRSLKRKEMIGWFTLGMTNSSEEEQAHWTSMRENHGEQVCRWHLLLEP